MALRVKKTPQKGQKAPLSTVLRSLNLNMLTSYQHVTDKVINNRG